MPLRGNMATAPARQRSKTEDFPLVREATLEEGQAMLDRSARRHLRISGEEFLRRWRRGDYTNDLDAPGVQEVAMLLPIAESPAEHDPLAADDAEE